MGQGCLPAGRGDMASCLFRRCQLTGVVDRLALFQLVSAFMTGDLILFTFRIGTGPLVVYVIRPLMDDIADLVI